MDANVSPLLVENRLWVLARKIGNPGYDFDFELFFACGHPTRVEKPQTVVARIGAFNNYESTCRRYEALNLRLANNVEEHNRSSLISHWYDLLSDLTPRTVIWDKPPSGDEVEQHFEWPVFVKGERQTNRHQAALSVAASPEEFDKCMAAYAKDEVLHWQKVAVREFVPLRPVPGPKGSTMPPSFEFRTFWWHGKLVGHGPYWPDVPDYRATKEEWQVAVKVATEAANRLAVPFLVVDLAMTIDGHWIVVETNDAQESGYSGVKPLEMWRRIIELETP